MSVIQVAAITDSSAVNGPGIRAVVHFQGCSLGCPGCFNPQTHPTAGGSRWPVSELADHLAGLAAGKDGVTISGGEPFQQPDGLRALAISLRARGVATIVVFSGYSVDELDADPARRAALEVVDVVVAGRYDPKQAVDGSILSSANQRAWFVTDVYGPEDLELGRGNVEFTITPDGDVRVTGFPSPALRKAVRELG